MQFDVYRRHALKTAAPLKRDQRLRSVALGLNGEAGEYADLLKKHYYHQTAKPLDRAKALKELGDVLWYVALAADTLPVTGLDFAVARNDGLLFVRTQPKDQELRQVECSVLLSYACAFAAEGVGRREPASTHKSNLGQILQFIAASASLFESSIEEVAELNVKKLAERYPKGFSAADSEARRDVSR